MTALAQLQHCAELAEKATPGPLKADPLDRNFNAWIVTESEAVARVTFADDTRAQANLESLVAARNLPFAKLAAVLERAQLLQCSAETRDDILAAALNSLNKP